MANFTRRIRFNLESIEFPSIENLKHYLLRCEEAIGQVFQEDVEIETSIRLSYDDGLDASFDGIDDFIGNHSPLGQNNDNLTISFHMSKNDEVRAFVFFSYSEHTVRITSENNNLVQCDGFAHALKTATKEFYRIKEITPTQSVQIEYSPAEVARQEENEKAQRKFDWRIFWSTSAIAVVVAIITAVLTALLTNNQ